MSEHTQHEETFLRTDHRSKSTDAPNSLRRRVASVVFEESNAILYLCLGACFIGPCAAEHMYIAGNYQQCLM